ncbi:hypothetical protein K8I61_06725 [bacterium]|nr:hypothetical protein [bacterium]
MGKDVIVSYTVDAKAADELARELLAWGWIRSDVPNLFMKTYKDTYTPQELVVSARAEFVECAAAAEARVTALVIAACAEAPALYVADEDG